MIRDRKINRMKVLFKSSLWYLFILWILSTFLIFSYSQHKQDIEIEKAKIELWIK